MVNYTLWVCCNQPRATFNHRVTAIKPSRWSPAWRMWGLSATEAELGNEYVHNVGTRSQLGAVMEARVIQGEMLSKLKHLQKTKEEVKATATNKESSQGKKEDMTVATSNSCEDKVRCIIYSQYFTLHLIIPGANKLSCLLWHHKRNSRIRITTFLCDGIRWVVRNNREKQPRNAKRYYVKYLGMMSTNGNVTGMMQIKTLSIFATTFFQID